MDKDGLKTYLGKMIGEAAVDKLLNTQAGNHSLKHYYRGRLDAFAELARKFDLMTAGEIESTKSLAVAKQIQTQARGG